MRLEFYLVEDRTLNFKQLTFRWMKIGFLDL